MSKSPDPSDLERLSAGSHSMRIGQGIDVHRFSDDPERELWLGLVLVPEGARPRRTLRRRRGDARSL